MKIREPLHPLKKLTVEEAKNVPGLRPEVIEQALAAGREERDAMEASTQQHDAVNPRVRFC